MSTQLMMLRKKAASWVYNAAKDVARCLCLLTREDVRAEILWTALRFRGPAIASLLLFIGLTLPDQTKEVYVALAENNVLIRGEHRQDPPAFPAGVQDPPAFPAGGRASSPGMGGGGGMAYDLLLAYFYLPFVFVSVACFIILACAKYIGSVDSDDVASDEILQAVRDGTIKWVPQFIGLLPLLGFAFGMMYTALAFRGELIAERLFHTATLAFVPIFLFWFPGLVYVALLRLTNRLRFFRNRRRFRLPPQRGDDMLPNGAPTASLREKHSPPKKITKVLIPVIIIIGSFLTVLILSWIIGRILSSACVIILYVALFASFLYSPPKKRIESAAVLHTCTWVIVAVILVILTIHFLGPKLAPSIGPISIVCLFASTLAFALTSLYLMGVRWKRPLTGVVVGVILLLSGIGWTNNDRLSKSETVVVREQGDAATPNEAYNAWRESVDFNATPIVIAAQGGGLYAAYHTAMALARLYDVDDQVGRRVLAISAVSGGAVGAAVFDAIHRSQICKNEPGKQTEPDCYTNAVRKVLKRDFLSPLLASMLFPDFAAGIIPNVSGITDHVSRARWLEDAFAGALRDLFIQKNLKSEDIDSILDTPILTPWKAEGRPILLLNTTDVDSGQRMVLTPLSDFPESYLRTYADVTGCKIRISQKCESPNILASSVVSARFPYLTPAAQLTIRDENDKERDARYVDGGYFENSGVETARDFIDAIASHPFVELIAMDFPPVQESDRSRLSSFDEFRAPIRALLATTSARGELAKQRATEVLGPDSNFRYSTLRLDDTERTYTLGWKLSENTFDRIECNIWNNEACVRLDKLQKEQAADHPIDILSRWSEISAWNRCIFDELLRSPRTEADKAAFCYSGNRFRWGHGGGGF